MGSGSSLSSIKSHNPTPIISQQLEKRLDNYEPFTLVCLDENLNNYDEQLRSVIDYVCCFKNLEECEQFILNNNNKYDQLFFIVSSQYATNIVSHIHDLPQIIAIYILQQNISNNKKKDIIDDRWTNRYTKMKGIYLDRDILLKELSSHVKIYTNIGDLLPITVYNDLDIVQTNDHLCFLFYQLFLKDYCLINSSSLTKTTLIELIKDYYHFNPHELNLINQFNNEYNSKKNILKWFFQESFLRKILTKSLLNFNIKVLFALRFFIKDMHKTMNDNNLSSNKFKAFNEQIFYRSQILSKETLERIRSNIGKLLSINNFFLATQDRHESLRLIRQNVSSTNFIYRILFEIQIPQEYFRDKQRPFIDISNLSTGKYTILFFIGSIFRINTVDFDIANDCWIIQLRLYDERTNEDFSQLFTFLNNNNSSIILANLLRQISPNSAEQFYKHLLKEKSESISKLECYHGLGLCSYSHEDYDQALDYFSKALEMQPNDQLIKSSIHNSLGLVYAEQDEFDQAHIHFSKALENSSLPLHIACAHHNLALIYSEQGEHNEELNHYQEAFRIREHQLPSNHLQMASLHNNIGIAYSDMNEYDQALSSLKTALQIRLKLLSDTHIDVARSYANIGAVFTKTKEYDIALGYFNKARLLFENQQQLSQQDIELIDKNIKIVNDKFRRKTC